MASRSRACVVVAALFGLPALAQISPGPLSSAHAALDSNAGCFSCHGPQKEQQAGKCLACHAEIAWLIQQHRGLHAQSASDDCAHCHPEHAGRAFELVQWVEGAKEKFDHRRAGFALDGAHRKLGCQDCHKAALERSPAATRRPKGSTRPHWTGLEPDCKSCHEDIHRGSLGSDCRHCHSVTAWSPAQNFDHAKTSFPLTGKHLTTDCAACHRAKSLVLPVDQRGVQHSLFKPLPHAECSACHRDPHAGRFGATCGQCHRTDDFHRVNEAGFDHSKTRFPLRGAHRVTRCAACHDTKLPNGGPKPRFERCNACHEDPHAGQGTLAGQAVDCSSCHGEAAFRPSTFTVVQHQSTRYPLEGKHAAVACQNCHKPAASSRVSAIGKAGIAMRPAHAICLDCHADPHGGQVAGRPDKGDCASCHGLGGWKPSRFGLAEHKATRFPLEGRHEKVDCAACHGATRSGLAALAGRNLGAAKVALALDETRCEQCHRNVHGPTKEIVDCRDCHGQESFRPSAIDVAHHARFRMPLDGAHRAVACVECHKALEAAPRRGAATLLLVAAPGPLMSLHDQRQRCSDCHRDPHAGQFSPRTNSSDCAACHDAAAFRPAPRFDHDRQAAFPLAGAHAKVACAACHKPQPAGAGRTVIAYRGTPTRCEDCHATVPEERKR